jgi:hypothetical protein
MTTVWRCLKSAKLPIIYCACGESFLTQIIDQKITDACTMQLLISAMETQTTQADGSCEMTPECQTQLMQGTGLAFQQTSRARAAILARLFDCMEGTDLSAHIYKLCIQMYKETKSLESWDHPAGTRTLFMQQSKYSFSLKLQGLQSKIYAPLMYSDVYFI